MENKQKLEQLEDSIEFAISKAIEADNRNVQDRLYDVLVEVKVELDEM